MAFGNQLDAAENRGRPGRVPGGECNLQFLIHHHALELAHDAGSDGPGTLYDVEVGETFLPLNGYAETALTGFQFIRLGQEQPHGIRSLFLGVAQVDRNLFGTLETRSRDPRQRALRRGRVRPEGCAALQFFMGFRRWSYKYRSESLTRL